MSQPTPAQLFAEAQARILALVRSSPAGDLERNLKGLLEQTFERLDLVTRSALEIERERLDRLQARVAALEARLAVESGDSADRAG
jgi:BMFP domain-containing protein YqiC